MDGGRFGQDASSHISGSDSRLCAWWYQVLKASSHKRQLASSNFGSKYFAHLKFVSTFMVCVGWGRDPNV